jgi:proteasome component ECM29
MASKGLAMIYELGDAATKAQLVSALVGTLVEGRRATTHKYTADSDETVFAAGQLGKTKEGGNISTYKELCALATELNQPDLIYKCVCVCVCVCVH